MVYPANTSPSFSGMRACYKGDGSGEPRMLLVTFPRRLAVFGQAFSLGLVVTLATELMTVQGVPVDFCCVRTVTGQREITCGFIVALGSALRNLYGNRPALKLRIGE